MKILLWIVCVLCANVSIACSCPKPDVDITRLEESAELVVLAQLRSGKTSLSVGERKYVFEIIKSFKGPAIDSVVVSTPRAGMSCGLKARRDARYVLFVDREGKKRVVNHCSSWPLDRQHWQQTRAFNEHYKLGGAEVLTPHVPDSN
jgi:hypothetical protein